MIITLSPYYHHSFVCYYRCCLLYKIYDVCSKVIAHIGTIAKVKTNHFVWCSYVLSCVVGGVPGQACGWLEAVWLVVGNTGIVRACIKCDGRFSCAAFRDLPFRFT